MMKKLKMITKNENNQGNITKALGFKMMKRVVRLMVVVKELQMRIALCKL